MTKPKQISVPSDVLAKQLVFAKMESDRNQI